MINNAKQKRIFLSYASDDLDMVKSIFAGLTKRKLSVWFDKEHLKTGPWKPQIMKAISRSGFFVICISNAALRKTGDERPKFQDHELNRAFEIAMAQPDSEFTIVPVRIEECDRGGQDVRLTSFQQYDLFDNFEKGLDKLSVDLGGISLSDALAEDTRSEDKKIKDRLMGKALTLYFAGKFSESIKILKSVTTIEPDSFHAWLFMGNVFEKMKRRDKALLAYDTAIALKPDNFLAWAAKGSLLLVIEQYDEGMEALAKSIELGGYPGNVKA